MKTVYANTISPTSIRKIAKDGMTALDQCGGNTGNVCFVDAVKEQIAYSDDISCYAIESYKDNALFVLPASNWFNLDGHVLRDIFLPLETKNVQLLVIGLGIQLGLNDRIDEFISEIIKNKGTIRALKILSEHSKIIGVRGNITGECLDKIGIHNWKVIGCPSFYEYYRHYGKKKIKKSSLSHVAINVTPGQFGEHRLIEYGIRTKCDYILQAMSDMPLVLWESRPLEERHLQQKFPGIDNISTIDVENYIKECGHIFYTRKDWSDYLLNNEVSFSIGSRFHGNMMAFTNGIPALWIMHDARTRELIEAMNLPHIFYNEIKNCSMGEVMEKCEYNDLFYKIYYNMTKEYVKLLEMCGVKHYFRDDCND